jgi:anthranilate synthase/aminodeoxychorismate synthase-like glutamine amidotransferase
VILIVDNYDSFVHNVARYFEELGAPTKVVRNDAVTTVEPGTKAVVVSPGPCTPNEAGTSLAVVREYSGRLPILGICLGHQVIGQAFGARVVRARHPMHGEASEIEHDGSGLFRGLPQRFNGGRYHSLIVELDGCDAPLAVTARSADGEIMAMKHRDRPTFGVQFHPESILTEHGYDLLRNFLSLAR